MSKEENEAIIIAAKLMAASARTAPKARGIDKIQIIIVNGKEKEEIAEIMDKIGKEKNRATFIRDAKNVRNSQAIVIIGVKGNSSKGINCNACGYNCEEFDKISKKKGECYNGPNCIMYAIDLGIALGSAVKTASILNIDNRIMFSIGVAAIKLGLIDSDIAFGIPLSISGKNIYFDRVS